MGVSHHVCSFYMFWASIYVVQVDYFGPCMVGESDFGKAHVSKCGSLCASAEGHDSTTSIGGPIRPMVIYIVHSPACFVASV